MNSFQSTTLRIWFSVCKNIKAVMQDTFERFYDDYLTLSTLFEELKLEIINKQNL